MKLSEWVKHARQSAKLSQEKLAHELGCTKGNVSGWENDRHHPSVAQVTEIVRITGVQYPGHGASAGATPDNAQAGDGDQQLPMGTVTLARLDVVASMGDGALVDDHPQVVQAITVRLTELKKQASFTNPPNLSVITGRGDSMLPTFSDGDMLLVDQNVIEHKIDAVFAFTYDGEFYVKTLQRVPGRGVMAVSHNRTVYEPFRIEPDRPFTIHGRVVLAWNARKL